MVSRSLIVAALVAAVSATPCKPPMVTPTLPVTGDPTQVLTQPVGLKLLKIAIGHGLQNYTCAAGAVNASSAGALAVLYDVTKLYPGSGPGSLKQADWDRLSTTVLFGQNIPLNLQNPSAAPPGSPTTPNKAAESSYGAVEAAPFIAPAPLTVQGLPPIQFLGRHYFDINNIPTFDLTQAQLRASVGKIDDIKPPKDADKGILGTAAVDWLRLNDNGKGLGKGVQSVYRVVTAGGASLHCADVGAAKGSVPYTAFYWFYGNQTTS